MTQKETILQMLRDAPDRTVSCREFAEVYAFHKLASRCSDLKKLGHEIIYIKPEPGQSCMDGKYQLVHDNNSNEVRYAEESNGQYVMFQEVVNG